MISTTVGNMLTLVTVIANLILGSLVLLSDPKKPIHISFAVFSFVTSAWAFSNFIFWIEPNLFILKTQYALGAAIIPTALLWMFPLSERRLTALRFVFLSVVGAIVIFLPYINGLIIKDLQIGFQETSTVSTAGLRINTETVPIITTGYLFDYYSILMTALYLFLIYQIVSGVRRQSNVKKLQLKYILVGSLFFGGVSILTNFVLPFFGIFPKVSYDAQSSIFFVAFSAYAILKYRLFNAKIIAAEVLTFITWIFLLIQLLSAESLREALFNGVLLVLIIFFGALFIRSVFMEVKQREKLEILTKELGAANEKLVKLDKLKSEFLSFASHQIKTPITIIKGYASLIADETYGPVSSKVKEVSAKIVSASDRMVSLVNNLLNLRKIEEGRMGLKFNEFNLVDLTRMIVSELQSMAQAKGLTLKTNIAEGKIMVKADEEKLRQVIQNIMDNAIKYTEKGWIEVSVQREGNSALISVSDSGQGISAEFLPHIFEQWTRDSEAAKGIQGTGLGLYIAKEIVLAHGGEIWAESLGTGSGSTFFVKLKLSE